MSIFSSQSTWGGMCSGANQSPVNLSQSIAKPCKLSCDLKIDDTNPSSAGLFVSDEGLHLMGALGSCKFRDATYSCIAITINHPSHHTIEGVQADGEVMAVYFSPTGERLHVSSLIRVSSSPSPSLDFFKQVVPFAQNTETNVNLNGWSLQHMVPADGSYFTYEGSGVVPGCWVSEWVVYKTMINMDQTDFAFLVKSVPAGSRYIQALGNRELFYNDSADTGFMPHDNKTYLVMRPLGSTKQKKKAAPLDKADLKTQAAKDNAAQPGVISSAVSSVTATDDAWTNFLEWLIFLVLFGATIYGWNYFAPSMKIGEYIYCWAKGCEEKK